MSSFSCNDAKNHILLQVMRNERETNHTPPLTDGGRYFQNQSNAKPNIYRYQDYRKFLKDWFDWKKRVNTGYSGTMFAKRAGFSSHTLLGMIIRGDRNLSYNSLRSFLKPLDFKASEKIYFEKLVLFNQSKNTEDRNDYFEQLASLSEKNGNSNLKDLKNYVKYISHWYNVAIRELVYLEDFTPDPEWISQKLKKKINKKEAASAWELLLELGLIKKNSETQKFEVSDPAIDIDPGGINFAIRTYHKEYLNLTSEAIDNEPISDRNLSSLTLVLSDSEFEDLKEKVNDFRKHVNLLYSRDQNKKDSEKILRNVVAINMQLLLLTSSNGKENGGKNGDIKN